MIIARIAVILKLKSQQLKKGYTWQEKSYDTIITCKNRDKCKEAMEYLKSKMK